MTDIELNRANHLKKEIIELEIFIKNYERFWWRGIRIINPLGISLAVINNSHSKREVEADSHLSQIIINEVKNYLTRLKDEYNSL